MALALRLTGTSTVAVVPAEPPAAGPTAVEPAEPALATETDAPEPPEVVDLNRATAEELARLSGISLTHAASIVGWRDQHGPIQQLADLLEAPGIGPATLRRLEGQVRLESDGE